MNAFLEQMRLKKRIKLTKKQTFFHYFFLPLILILGAVIFFAYEKNANPINKTISISILLVTALLAVIYFIRQWRSLNFMELDLKIKWVDFDKEIQILAKSRNWIPEYITEDWLIYSTAFKWYNWGTVIYIIRNEDSVMIRSICELYNRPSTLSFGVNKENMKAFMQHFKGLT